MMFTERQKELLEKIISEYINSAKPVSSGLLKKKYNLKISPAMIRIEMEKLTKNGYLQKPFSSAGRIPTDKAYRFFVDNLPKKRVVNFKKKRGDWLKNSDNTLKLIQSLTKELAVISRSFVLSYIKDEKIFWKDGWREIIGEPEFKDKEFLEKFAGITDELEEYINDFAADWNWKKEENVKVFIGKENPLPEAEDFSLIISRLKLPKKERGNLFLLGPKRMDYEKNINLINSLTELLEKL